MKKLFTLFIILSTSIGFSQTSITNGGFESWSDLLVKDSIVNWTTSTMEYMSQGINVNNSYLVSNAQDGASAIHLETEIFTFPGTSNVDTLFGYAVNLAANDQGFIGFPYTDTVEVLKGWYKCDVQAGDTAYSIIELRKGGNAYSTAVYQFYGAQSTWTQFSIPLPNGGTEEPDSVFVGFASSDPNTPGIAKDGSWLEIDNIWFEHTGTSPAAIPNYSFELDYQDYIQQADGWWSFDPITYNMAGSTYTTKSTDAFEGSSSLEIATTSFNSSNNIPSIVTNGFFNIGSSNLEGGTPFIAQPDSLVGEFKYLPAGTDTAFIWLQMWNGTSGFLVDTLTMYLSTPSWSTFSIPLNLTEAPDSMRITMFAGSSVGSVFRVDDLRFLGGDLSSNETELKSFDIYPNPANEYIHITTGNSEYIEVIDMNGKILYRSNSTKSIMKVETSNWQKGIYFVRSLDKNNNWMTKKLVIQ